MTITPHPYQRIADDVRGLIAAGKPLPSLSELGRQYGTTRNTVRKALGLLKDEGLLGTDRKPIGRNPIMLRLSDEETLTFIEDMIRGGHVVETPKIWIDHRGGELVRTVLRVVDGQPHNWAEWVFPLEWAAGTRLDYDTDIEQGSVRYLKEGLGWAGLVQEKWIEARMPVPAETDVLRMTGGPVLVEHRTGTADGEHLFSSRRILRADRTRLIP